MRFSLARCLEIRESSLSEDCLCDNTREGEHSKSAVDNFLKLHVLDLLFGLALEESSIKSEVSGGASGSLQHLNNGNGVEDLKQTEP